MNQRFKLLFVFLTLLMAAFPAIAISSIKIMPVGDSDVSGQSGFVSYRYDLWFLLQNAGYDVDFVGRLATPPIAVDADLYPDYESFDNQHEGRNGYLLNRLSSGAQAMVESNDPDIVLILLSTDLCENGSGAVSLATVHFSSTIDNMRAVNPNLHFVLGLAYPWFYNECRPDLIPDYNQSITQVANTKDTANSRVIIADHFTGFNTATMIHDDTHANRQGEMFIAENWFDALETVIPLVEVEEESFQINAGLNDAWFDPATAGQGFFITVFPNIEMIFLAWFTYDTERPDDNVMANLGEPGHRWLTAFGPYTDNVALLDIEVTSGGVFDAATPQPDQQADGSIMLEFTGCNEAMVTYEITSLGLVGEIPIQRIALDNVSGCETLAGQGSAAE